MPKKKITSKYRGDEILIIHVDENLVYAIVTKDLKNKTRKFKVNLDEIELSAQDQKYISKNYSKTH